MRFRTSLLGALVFQLLGGVSENHASASVQFQRDMSCEVTPVPTSPFTPPSPYPAIAPSKNFWYGHEGLWTMLQSHGTWARLPRNDKGYRQKVFWWHPGFDGRVEARPNLIVTGRRLDGTESFVNPTPATNARHADFGGWTILTGIDVPTTGCWELTGTYRGQSVSFVVWITD